MAGPLRVVVIDDHQVFGVSLARALSDEDDIEIVGVATSMATALVLVTPDVDVALCDFRLADGDGITLTRSMLQQCPQLKVVMLTASNDDAVLAVALEAGCAGFVTKSEPLATVVHAVRSAAVGEAVITPALLARLLPRLGARQRGRNPDLSPREQEVLVLVARGGSNQQIADALNLSRDTVRNHVSAVLSKLGVNSKLQAAAVAVQRGLIDLSP